MVEEKIKYIPPENLFIGDEPDGTKGDEIIYKKGVLGRYEGRIYAWRATAGGAYEQRGNLEVLGPNVDIVAARFHGKLVIEELPKPCQGIYYFVRFDDNESRVISYG